MWISVSLLDYNKDSFTFILSLSIIIFITVISILILLLKGLELHPVLY